jgi:hypothetical protein
MELDPLTADCVLKVNGTRRAAMKAVAWPPKGNRWIGHDDEPP